MLPSEVNILGSTFQVSVEKLPDDMCGDSSATSRLIRIDSELSYSLQVETFYHELVHVLMGHLGVDYLLSDKEQEVMAQSLGMALTYVVTANNLPKLGESK